MTLGRTASNAIKIKTGVGTTRAVECECCVTAVCGCSNVSSALQSIIESATQINVNGVFDAWNGTLSQQQLGFGKASWFISYSSGIICAYADNGDNTVKLAPEPLTLEECTLTPMSVIGAPVLINGLAFRAVHAFPDFQINLNITFS